MRYRIVKIVEAKDIREALKKEPKANVETIEKLPENTENHVGY